jgi:hypothetical protein
MLFIGLDSFGHFFGLTFFNTTVELLDKITIFSELCIINPYVKIIEYENTNLNTYKNI